MSEATTAAEPLRPNWNGKDYPHHPGNDPREPRQVRVGDCVIDQRVQRTRQDEEWRPMAQRFDWCLAEVATAVQRPDGALVIVEGQGRVLALQAIDPDIVIWLLILPGRISEADQAGLARDISKSRKPMTAFQTWQQNVRNGVPHFVAAEEVFRERGLRISDSSGSNTITCPVAITSIIKGGRRDTEAGAALLAGTLDVIFAAWPDRGMHPLSERWNNSVIRAVAAILSKYGLDNAKGVVVETGRLAARLGTWDAGAWVQYGKAGDGPPVVVITERLIAEYNRSKRVGRLG